MFSEISGKIADAILTEGQNIAARSVKLHRVNPKNRGLSHAAQKPSVKTQLEADWTTMTPEQQAQDIASRNLGNDGVHESFLPTPAPVPEKKSA